MDFFFGRSDMMEALETSDEAALNELCKLDEQVMGEERSSYLSKAIAMRGTGVLEAMLDRFPKEEHSGFLEADAYRAVGGGSLLLNCAVLDRPAHARLLMDRGYDPNGSGLELADYLDQRGNYWSGYAPGYGKYMACFSNHISVECTDNSSVGINCATPLAAAIFMGSLETAKVLLQNPGTWKTESSSVCRSVVMALEGIAARNIGRERCKNRAEILRMLLYPEKKELPPKEQILRENYLQPVSFVDICSAKTLALQLESGFCTDADCQMLVDKLERRKPYQHRLSERGMSSKLLLIKKYFPEQCKSSRVKGLFLEKIFLLYMHGAPYQSLLKAWKQLSGRNRDITWISGHLWNTNIKLKSLLDILGEGGKLTIDADAFGRWYGGQSSGMRELLKRVEIRRNEDGRLSGAVCRLLNSSDLRLLKFAAQNGIFAREDPKMLMEYMVKSGNTAAAVRSLVLISAQNERNETEPKQDWRDADRWAHWTEHWGISEEENAEQIKLLMEGGHSRDEYLKAMSRVRQFMNQDVFPREMDIEMREFAGLKTDSLLGIACCSESTEPLAVLLEKMPWAIYDTVRASFGDEYYFRGSALSFCAALGKTEHMKLIIGKGWDPRELGRGDACRFYIPRKDFSQQSVLLTPLLTAVLFGKEEGARLLIAHGASCDLSKKAQQKALIMGSADSLAVAQKLNLPGLGSLDRDVLGGIEISTAQGGSGTKMWNKIKTGSCA